MSAGPQSHLPLTAVAYEILLALSQGDLHGYAIMQAVEESTGGTMALYPGTFYRAVDGLERKGLVAESKDLPIKGEDQRRRYHALTGLGRSVVIAESKRLAERVAVARSRNLLPAGA